MTEQGKLALNRAMIRNYIKGLPKKFRNISFASLSYKGKTLQGVRIIFRDGKTKQEFLFEAPNMETDIEELELVNLKIADLCLS